MSIDIDSVLPTGDLLVGGRFEPGSGKTITSINPATGEELISFSGASRADVDTAVRAADAARRSPEWVSMLPHQRAAVLHSISDGIRANVDRISLLQTLDTGKTTAETTALALSAAGTFRYIASVLEVAPEELTPSRGDYLTLSVHDPIGVVAAITPWNSPIASDAQKVAPALAAGNGVVLKPASWAPLVSLELARIAVEAGLPEGLLSVIPGSGSEAGDALIRHPLVKKVSFTGGTSTGRRIAGIAAERLIPTSLELGGKSPTIVCEDADLDQALAGVLFGIFSSQGQSCIAGSRLFVHDKVRSEFVQRLCRATEALVVGDPLDPATQVGPLIHQEHRAEVEGMIDRAVADGATVETGGNRPTEPALASGSYLRPTVLSGMDNDSFIAQQEIFGPVLVVLGYSDEDDLIAQANDSIYGLAAGIWTADYRRAWRIGRALNTGTVWINTYKQLSISTPFGGVGESGWGREKGIAAVRQYQNQKSMYLDLSGQPLPWARIAQHGDST